MEELRTALRPYQPGWWLQLAIRGYRRLLSPVLGRRCRYLPTCSEYGHDAIGEWGAVRGTWMAIKRVGRCNPFREGGFDPVPRRAGHTTDVEVEAH